MVLTLMHINFLPKSATIQMSRRSWGSLSQKPTVKAIQTSKNRIRKGLGYVSPRPVRIFIKRATSNCITFTDEEEGDKRQSVFDRIGKLQPWRSVFHRLGSNLKPAKRKSIHDKLGAARVLKEHINTSIEIESLKRLRSTVPSRMRREIDIHVSCNEVLKVKPKTIIYTRVQLYNEEMKKTLIQVMGPHQPKMRWHFHPALLYMTRSRLREARTSWLMKMVHELALLMRNS